MLEVELKARINNIKEHEDLIKRLSPLKIEIVTYYDTYLDTEDAILRIDDRELRVRSITDGKSEVILTYKDKPFDEETKSKSELEVKLDNHEGMIEILKGLGFIIDIIITKRCKNYYFNYMGYPILATLVRIEELDSWFIEIETLVKMLDQVCTAKNTLYELFSYLNISRSAITAEYYTDLVRAARNHTKQT